MNVGFYYQVYKQPKATLEALKDIRKFFPQAPVYLVSDYGYDYSVMAKRYNCAYEHSDLSVGRCEGCKDIHNVYPWLERIDRAIEYCQTPWMIKMEDDVSIRNKITRIPTCAAAGTSGRWNPQLSKQFIAACEKKSGVKVKYNYYGMCGGSIFKSKKFKEGRQRDGYDVEECHRLDKRTATYGDAILTAFFYMNGMRFFPWRDLSEPWDKCKDAAFHHPCKKYYNKKLTAEEKEEFKL